ncbi:eukaryotic translation initiation factor 3 subunit L [Exaiptasia diaphana]|uniref:Eukaryotic translation initiation factor 3 subunit L n=1 Tax=Exaiptasia diaphana TaxID=2652724 RepID=A0A913X5T1_EXADI|nr:eukaryotic translation initiation factor 3 subunit L [Exaiptasia diaphana]KXJ28540.1 Eukaryotic translation initiation factor 3 subunit L [Exaiptasia diaphana]
MYSQADDDDADNYNGEYDDVHTLPAYHMPEEIKGFIHFFHKHIIEQNLHDIQLIYENGFNRLTERYFNKSPWPEADYISPLVEDDQVFLILYKELYYRHIYNKLKPTLDQRFESYYNYCDLFNYILNTDEPVPLTLPNQWLWDIIDEFIYQFQSFSQFRSKLQKKPDEEVGTLKANTKIWNVHSVLNVLYSLVEKSNINQQLQVYSSGGDPDSVAGEFGIHSLYKMLGYFSLIGLLRLHSLLGDYFQAIKVLSNVELNKKSLYSRIPACQITTYYYVGFAYLMMKRYQDAIRTFSNILLYIQRTKQMFQTKSYQFEQIMKKGEQMYSLLAIAVTLCPERLDENVSAQMREKCGEKLQKLQRGDLQAFEECFSYACPKFISPVPPNFDAPANYNREPFNLQLKVFMNEVAQQSKIPIVRSYLKLYTTMPISKLAAFLDMDEDTFRNQLLCYKHKQRNLVWTLGKDALDGELQSSSEVDFYIDKDMIHIADTKVERRYGEFFIRQIHKCEELARNLQGN